MIRYPVTRRELRRRVSAHDPNWLAKAATRTQRFINQGKFNERSHIWSDIKVVFMHLQHNKCVFCERALAGERFGRGEHDLEHCRPKSSVKAWPTRKISRERNINYTFGTGAASPTGYYWLAYDIQNYAAACKPCNSALKSNYFPIADNRGGATATVRQLNQREKPFVIFPIGSVDDDPERLISFDGITAVPKMTRGRGRRRAQVTIDFFELNRREDLWRGRFRAIRELWAQFERRKSAVNLRSRQDANQMINELTSSDSPHASCARNFLDLCKRNPDEAWDMYLDARDYSGGIDTN